MVMLVVEQVNVEMGNIRHGEVALVKQTRAFTFLRARRIFSPRKHVQLLRLPALIPASIGARCLAKLISPLMSATSSSRRCRSRVASMDELLMHSAR